MNTELENALDLVRKCPDLTSEEIDYVIKNASESFTDRVSDEVFYSVYGKVEEICAFSYNSKTDVVDLLSFEYEPE